MDTVKIVDGKVEVQPAAVTPPKEVYVPEDILDQIKKYETVVAAKTEALAEAQAELDRWKAIKAEVEKQDPSLLAEVAP